MALYRGDFLSGFLVEGAAAFEEWVDYRLRFCLGQPKRFLTRTSLSVHGLKISKATTLPSIAYARTSALASLKNLWLPRRLISVPDGTILEVDGQQDTVLVVAQCSEASQYLYFHLGVSSHGIVPVSVKQKEPLGDS